MTYRSDVDALAARHQALDAEVNRVQRERDAARQLLENAKERLHLPVLDNIRVASPCKEDWNAMQGDERARHCLRCDQNVYNLSDMTREEAEALILAKEGKLCVRYYRRKQDGTILVKDCRVGATRKRRWLVGAGMMAGIAASLLGWFGRKSSHHSMGSIGVDPSTDYEAIAGGIGPSRDYEVEMGGAPGHDYTERDAPAPTNLANKTVDLGASMSAANPSMQLPESK